MRYSQGGKLQVPWGYVAGAFGRGEAAQIRARYGNFLVSVEGAQVELDPARQIRLSSMTDLVKLAKKDARMIMHGHRDSRSHVYFVQVEGLTYLYEIPASSSALTTGSLNEV